LGLAKLRAAARQKINEAKKAGKSICEFFHKVRFGRLIRRAKCDATAAQIGFGKNWRSIIAYPAISYVNGSIQLKGCENLMARELLADWPFSGYFLVDNSRPKRKISSI
jgi:hypothetical protein